MILLLYLYRLSLIIINDYYKQLVIFFIYETQNTKQNCVFLSLAEVKK